MEFELKTTIKADRIIIFKAWLSSEGHAKMTGAEAKANDIVGEKFSAWDGYITGTNLIVESPNRIVQSWRTSEFAEDAPDSQIEITLDDKDGGTELTLKHSKIEGTGEHYIEGWKEHYFEPMKAYFEN